MSETLNPTEIQDLRDLVEKAGWLELFEHLHALAQAHVDALPPDANLDHPLYDVRNLTFRGLVDIPKAMKLTNRKWTYRLVPKGQEKTDARDFEPI